MALIESVAPRVVIEVGVNEGLTAKAVLANVPSIEHYVGIDVPVGYITERLVQRGEVPPNPGALATSDPRFDLIVRPRGSLDLGPEDLPPCDVMFIDGDHGRKGVTHDTMLATALVRRDGIIIWHDYHDLGTVDVRDVLDELQRSGRNIRNVERTWLAYERR